MIRTLRVIGWMVGLCLALYVGTAHAQTSRVNAGDVLRIDVEGRADISGNYAVDKDGKVTLPILGRIAALGRTPQEISTDVARRMSLISSKITQVAVTMAQAASKRNFVLGAVLLPGMYVFKDPPTVWEAITEAGGPTDDADLTGVEILSESQPRPTVVDVTSGPGGDVSRLPRLKAGDTVRVPRHNAATSGVAGDNDMIYVFGAVGQQGPQPLALAPDLVSAFIRAIPTQGADFENVQIVRKNGPQIVRIKVSMGDYFEKGDLVGNPKLQAGDTVRFQHEGGGFHPLSIIGAASSIIALTTSILVHSR